MKKPLKYEIWIKNGLTLETLHKALGKPNEPDHSGEYWSFVSSPFCLPSDPVKLRFTSEKMITYDNLKCGDLVLNPPE